MRHISTSEITSKVKELCIRAACELGSDVVLALEGFRGKEESPLGKEVLDQIIENAQIALKEDAPMCQDTGIAVFFVEIGRNATIDGSLEDAINEGVRQGYAEGYLRKSVCHPLTRKNTEDNTPAIIHTNIVDGDKVKITIAPKGAGSENMSRLAMLKPSQGLPAIKDFVINTVKDAGGNPCPPIIVGIGIGGNFEKSAILAKESLLREVGSDNPDKELDALEKELLEKVNNLGIGPMGFGGRTTALAVHIKTAPCHIASLPVAVNVQCHAARHKEAII
ncbi:MAG: fumarate hydratase [Deltaproteobacteria bacterium GWC2_42_51]|nr:MAG: fumarate hydratase [Deltaproteobacteria bacterium GWC2_42_51]OGP38187.1 MAG: fumarate hydratase [Deltaproteobacteria bacterium GWD2_42_10]OGP47482.1 MAG: fumarate hydratase [Deltaproteobacteria bacterium GWF2_42_12]OGQ37029.1 MAG: fumarate hydratase [Deltaproteobacteria bacterium RIFCSPLOWO2_02_FULL_42_39]OGQ73883.1 MAG: fumarate hydratase [Deltaproteobacteria bacterium RIFOXYA2_FULL_42_10]HAG51559.1 fumarate hydratase [Deltaproteobacteria bacterium]